MGLFGEYIEKRATVNEADEKTGEAISPESREKEYTSEDKRKPFTYKPDAPIDLPQGVMEIFQAFQNKELLTDIEAELWKAVPNGKLYHIEWSLGTLLVEPKPRLVVRGEPHGIREVPRGARLCADGARPLGG